MSNGLDDFEIPRPSGEREEGLSVFGWKRKCLSIEDLEFFSP